MAFALDDLVTPAAGGSYSRAYENLVDPSVFGDYHMGTVFQDGQPSLTNCGRSGDRRDVLQRRCFCARFHAVIHAQHDTRRWYNLRRVSLARQRDSHCQRSPRAKNLRHALSRTGADRRNEQKAHYQANNPGRTAIELPVANVG